MNVSVNQDLKVLTVKKKNASMIVVEMVIAKITSVYVLEIGLVKTAL